MTFESLERIPVWMTPSASHTRLTAALCWQTSNRRIATFWIRGCCLPIILCYNTTHSKKIQMTQEGAREGNATPQKDERSNKEEGKQWQRSSSKETWCAKVVQRINKTEPTIQTNTGGKQDKQRKGTDLHVRVMENGPITKKLSILAWEILITSQAVEISQILLASSGGLLRESWSWREVFESRRFRWSISLVSSS